MAQQPQVPPVDLTGGLVPKDAAQVPIDLSGGLVPKDTASNPTNVPAKPDSGMWTGIKRNTVGMIAGLYHAFTDPATDQEKAELMQKVQTEKEWQRAHGYDPNDVSESLATDPSSVTLAYHRLIDAPAKHLQEKGVNKQAAAKDLLSTGHLWKGSNLYTSGATDRLLSNVPGVGPWLNGVAERAERGDISGAATDIAAAAAFSRPSEFAKTPVEFAKRVAPEMTSRVTGAVGKAVSAPAEWLKGSAQRSYEEVLNPTRQDTKYQTQKIMPRLLEERPVAMTRKGLAEKAEARAETAGQQIERQVSNLQGEMPTKTVIDGLQNLKKTFQVRGVSLRPEVNNAIDAVSEQFQQMGDDVSYQDAVAARRILDDAVSEAKGYQGAQLSDASLAKVRRAAANSIRSELGKASPELADVNATFHFWNSLNEVMEATIQRKIGQAPMRETIQNVGAAAAGAVRHGLKGATGYGAAMWGLGKAFRSTAWRTVSAATKASIADALVSGDFSQVMNTLGKAGLTGQMATGATNTDTSEWIPIQASGKQYLIHPEDFQEAQRRDPNLRVLGGAGSDWIRLQFANGDEREIHFADLDKALKQNPNAKVISNQ